MKIETENKKKPYNKLTVKETKLKCFYLDLFCL